MAPVVGGSDVSLPRGVVRALVLLVAVVALVLGHGPPPAGAGTVYSPEDVSPATAATPQMLIDRSGAKTLVWSRLVGDSPVRSVIEFRRLLPGGSLGPITTLSDPTLNSYDPEAVVDSLGRITVVWYTVASTNSSTAVISRRIGADGAVEGMQTLSPKDGGAYAEQRAVIDPADRVTVVWASRYEHLIQSRRLDTNGTPGPINNVSVKGEGDALLPAAAVDSAGRVTVVWDDNRNDGQPTPVRARRLSSDGSIQEPIRTISADGDSGAFHDLAVDSDGRATVVWKKIVRDGSELRSWVQERRIEADGSLGPVQDISPPGTADKIDGTPQVAIDSLGRATATWTRVLNDTNIFWVQARRIAADGSPEGIVDVAGPDKGIAFDPVVEAFGDRAAVAFVQRGERVNVVRLRPFDGNGAPGPVQTLSTDEFLNNSVGDPTDLTFATGGPALVWARAGIVQTPRARVIPVVKIVKGPKRKTTKRKATFKFRADEPRSSFDCKLDKGKWRDCSSPVSYKHLKPGKHVFRVRATLAGEGGAGDGRKWTVKKKRRRR